MLPLKVSRLAGEHKLNLLFKTTRWSETANGSLVLHIKKEPRPRGQDTRREIRRDLHPRSSQARQESFCPLDKDLSWKSGNRKLAAVVFLFASRANSFTFGPAKCP